jgi:hypothetical protein
MTVLVLPHLACDRSKREPMSRDEVLTLYRPIRAAIMRVLSAAVTVCNQADWRRAARQLGLWANGEILLPEGDKAAEMLSDVALFEPSQRKQRAFDRFLSDKARRLDAADFDIAQRMGKAFFSLFRCAEKHNTAGVWLEDLLDGNRRIWLMDESFEAAGRLGEVFGIRLFDAGAFHAGFGIVVTANEETTRIAMHSRTRDGRLPLRHSLALTLYGDSLRQDAPISPELEEAVTLLLARAVESSGGLRRQVGGRSVSRKEKRRGRK